MQSKIRFRHLRRKDKSPVGTMGTLEKDGKFYVSFCFLDKVDIFKKYRGREIVEERLNRFFSGDKRKYTGETTHDEIISFINKTKQQKIDSSSGFKRNVRKMFENILKPERESFSKTKKYVFHGPMISNLKSEAEQNPQNEREIKALKEGSLEDKTRALINAGFLTSEKKLSKKYSNKEEKISRTSVFEENE